MVKRLLIAIISGVFLQVGFSQSAGAQNCVPAFEYIPFAGPDWVKPNPNTGVVDLGTYSRISPDGNYVLRSLSGQFLSSVTLMKLTSVGDKNPKAEAIETRFANEAFAVQGTWRFLVEINRAHHRFSSVVNLGKKSASDFKAGVSGFYATAAEIKGDASRARIRSLSWPSGDMNSGSMGEGQLYNRVFEVEKQTNGEYKVINETGNKYLCANLSGSEGSLFTLPMISVFGDEFSAMPVRPKNGKPSMRIYKIGDNNQDCELVDDLGVAVSKLIFGFPRASGKPYLVYQGAKSNDRGAGIYVYDRDIKAHFELYGLPKPIVADSFPGFAKDGRVIVAAHWNECAGGACQTQSGYLRIDPYQTDYFVQYRNTHHGSSIPRCITMDQVSDSEKWMKEKK